MATKVVMEALSPTMEEGRLVKWLKSEGDTIAKGDPLAEVETDKAVMEIVARGDGVLRKHVLGEGGTAPVGSLVGVIAASDENIDSLLVGAGDKPGAGATTEAASTETADTQAAAQAPREKATAGRPGSTAPKHRDPPLPQPATEQAPHAGDGERLRSSPLARRLAAERGVELGAVQGTGPAGRIIKRDIEAALEVEGGTRQAAREGAPAPPRMAGAREASGRDYEDVPLSQMRKTIAKRLAESIGPVPTFYLTSEIDMERVAEMRSAMTQLGDEYKVSFNDIVLKAVATALTLHPEVNGHWMGDRIRYFSRVHIGMAVAIEEGLITPVLFDADRKRLSELSREARDLAGRARELKLKPDEYTGSTFSVSNLGMFGIDQFTAIINPPEAGILAVGAVEEKPVAIDGQLTPRKRMRVTMSCDHRVIDGATGAKFLQTLRRMLENPLMLVY